MFATRTSDCDAQSCERPPRASGAVGRSLAGRARCGAQAGQVAMSRVRAKVQRARLRRRREVLAGMDFGPVRVRIGATVPRVACPKHGVATAAVPWAKHGCRFTTDFACLAAWMVKGGLSKKRVSEYLGIDWDTVGRLVDLVWHELEPDVKGGNEGSATVNFA